MTKRPNHSESRCCRVPRRAFLADLGMGFTGLALGAMLSADGVARAAPPSVPDGGAHFRPRAKSVIWIFLSGGYSHVETFDPKPSLNRRRPLRPRLRDPRPSPKNRSCNRWPSERARIAPAGKQTRQLRAP